MAENKIVSVRMEDRLIEMIDKQVERHRYWKRSNIICNILEAVLTRFDEKEIYDMIRMHYYRNNVVNTKFEVTGELMTPKPRDNG